MSALNEVETFSKPGTADVTPGDRKKLAGLLKHYGKMAHPFSTCKRDQIKHGLTPDHANRRCAVIVDLIKGGTGWRGKGKTKAQEQIAFEIAGEAHLMLSESIDLLGPHTVAMAVATDLPVGLSGTFTDALRNATKIAEAVPAWMLPPEARKPGFKPTNPEKPADGDFEKKHPRGGKGSPTGGQFVRKGSTGNLAAGAMNALGMKGSTFNERRVRQFQRNHGLEVDGVIGRQTAAAMRGNKNADKIETGSLTAADRRFLKRKAN